MSEFQPGIVPVMSSKWQPTTSKGFQIMSLQGPDPEGYWAGTIKDASGRIAGHSYLPCGTVIDAPEEYNLVPKAKPALRVVFVEITLNSFGLPVVLSASDKRFPSATTAMVFDSKNNLVGSKTL